MSILTIVAVSSAITVTALAILALTDPKRRRKRQSQSAAMTAARYVSVAAAWLPGIWLLVTLQSASLFIWLGAAALGGWFVTLLLPRIGEKSS